MFKLTVTVGEFKLANVKCKANMQKTQINKRSSQRYCKHPVTKYQWSECYDYAVRKCALMDPLLKITS